MEDPLLLRTECEQLISELEALRASLLLAESELASQLTRIHPSYVASARNLVHYLTLRRSDLRTLQSRMSQLGLSSLGRAEPRVMANLEAVLTILYMAIGLEPPVNTVTSARSTSSILATHTEDLLGPRPAKRHTRIMVTLPTAAADDPKITQELLISGMNCARINCAHDDSATWERMIKHLRTAQSWIGQPCKLIMDLAGPKLRTGPLAPGPQVLKWRPLRDPIGRVSKPADIFFVPVGHRAIETPSGVTIPVDEQWLARLGAGDRIRLTDARGRRRTIELRQSCGPYWHGQCERTGYLIPGISLTRLPANDSLNRCSQADVAVIGELPFQEVQLRLRPGDKLRVTRGLTPGGPAGMPVAGGVLGIPQIGCTLSEVFDQVRPGERIMFDDGKFEGVIEQVERDAIVVMISRAANDGPLLKSDKGINLPDSDLRLPALTAKDEQDLEFVARHAHAVALSFVQDASAVEELERRLSRLKATQVGIVLKIETARAFIELPNLLLASMQSPCDGVMIARGDLFVECGFERMAEVQESILSICEAAHIPVIWATQVLEHLAKHGTPTRAEISDVALATRAECVMLNKGPHINSALKSLDDILRRMETHQSKKRSLLCRLPVAGSLSGPRELG